MAWVDALVLRSDEKVIDSWQGIREIVQEVVEGKPDEAKKGNKVTIKERREGLLVLTNQRLLFLEGLEPDGKWRDDSVRMSLIDVDKLWFEKAPLKPIEKVKGLETHVFKLKRVGKKKQFNDFKKLIEEYCQKRKDELAKETQKVVRFKV